MFYRYLKLILRFVLKDKETKLGKRILKEKNRVERLTLPDFKTCYRATVIK